MSMTEVQAMLRIFPERERLELAAWLLESVSHRPDDATIAESAELARLRQAKLDSGDAASLPEDEFWTKVHQSIGE